MASIRLTNAMRERIGNKVIAYKYENNSGVNDLVKEAASLATAVYNEAFTEKQRELIKSLPVGWMRQDDKIGAQFGNSWTIAQLKFNGDIGDFVNGYEAKQYVRTYTKDLREVYRHVTSPEPSRHYYNNHISVQFDTDHALTSRFTNLKNKIDTHIEEWRKDKLSIKTTLGSFTTAQKLMAEWPEVKPFVLQIIGGTSKPVQSTALAISREKLNERFGLPMPEKAA